MSHHVIEQHSIDLAWAREELEDGLQQRGRLITRMRERPSLLEGLAASVDEHFMYTAAVEPDSPALMEAARVAARVLTTLIGFANGDSQARVIDLGSTRVEAAPFPAKVSALQWLHAFSYALIARDEEASERLVETEIHTLQQGASEKGMELDGYHYIWVAALKSWRLGRDVVNHLIDLRRSTEPGGIEIAAPEMVRSTQEMAQALAAFLSDETDVFNDSLAAAVEQHKAWWLQQERSARKHASFVALEPLALACAAHDGGMKVTVESDYLPASLITAK
jgi:hypothetical protein